MIPAISLRDVQLTCWLDHLSSDPSLCVLNSYVCSDYLLRCGLTSQCRYIELFSQTALTLAVRSWNSKGLVRWAVFITDFWGIQSTCCFWCVVGILK